MNDMYELVNAADPLKKIQGNEGQMKVLAAMTQQTLECAFFIRDYCTDASLGVSSLYTLSLFRY